MQNKLGLVGIVGVVLLLVGLAVIAYVDPVIAGGVALVIAGLLFALKGVVDAAMQAMGMGGMM